MLFFIGKLHLVFRGRINSCNVCCFVDLLKSSPSIVAACSSSSSFSPTNLVRSWSFWSNLWHDIYSNINNSKTWMARRAFEENGPILNHHFGWGILVLQESMDVISSTVMFLQLLKNNQKCNNAFLGKTGCCGVLRPIFFDSCPSSPLVCWAKMEGFLYIDLWGRKAWVQIASKDAIRTGSRHDTKTPSKSCLSIHLDFAVMRLCCKRMCTWFVSTFTVGFPTNQLFIQCIIPKKQTEKEMNHHIIQWFLFTISHHFGWCFILKSSKNLSFLWVFCGRWPPQNAHLFGTVSPQGELHLGMEGPIRDV